MSQLITFYSYKGGVGRTMALANVSIILARWGYRTLIIDWDLEAPGLEMFFKPYIKGIKSIKSKPGILDILTSLGTKDRTPIKWQDCIIPILIENSSNVLHLLTAGKRDNNYSERLRNFNLDDFYGNFNGGIHIENLRSQFLERYDFVLIDSRTGVTDFGGICTIQLPDILVLLFTPTEQSIDGVLDIAKRSVKAQLDIPFDRLKLITLPIPTRIDKTEYEMTNKWISKISKQLSEIMNDWIPKAVSKVEFIQLAKIPYVPFFSYGEQLPVIEQSRNDTSGLHYAYENLASLLSNNLEKIELLIENRTQYLSIARKNYKNKRSKGIKIKMFLSYSNKDIEYAEEIMAHLSILKSFFDLEIWSAKNIKAGDNWKDSIQNEIKDSDVFLFLISSDFLASHYVDDEISFIQKIKSNNPIIPILLKPSFFSTSKLYNYNALPQGAKPISEFNEPNLVYKEITDSIKVVIESYIISATQHSEQISAVFSSNSSINSISMANTFISTTIAIQTILGEVQSLKEDFEDERKLLQKSMNDDEIDVTIRDIEKAETAIKEIETAQSQGGRPAPKSTNRLKRFIDDLSDEESTLHKGLKVLRKGKDYGVTLAETYNKIAPNIGLPLVPPLALEVIKSL